MNVVNIAIISAIASIMVSSGADAYCYQRKKDSDGNIKCIDTGHNTGWDSTCTSRCGVAVVSGKRVVLIRKNNRWQER